MGESPKVRSRTARKRPRIVLPLTCEDSDHWAFSLWSLLKRGINGTYVTVEPFHLFGYLDEQAYRYNNRKLTDAERFDIAVRGIVGKWLTFDQLTGKESASQLYTN